MSEGADSKNKPLVVCRTDTDACDSLDMQLSRSWLKVGVAAVFAGQGMVFSLAMNMTPPAYGSVAYWVLHGGLIFSSLIVAVFLGGPLFVSTFSMLRARRVSVEGLFTLSLLGAFGGSLASTISGQGAVFYEVVSVVVAIYTIGRMLSERSQSRLKAASEEVLEAFDQARVLRSGEWLDVAVAEVLEGDLVRVGPGEPFSVDGVLVEGVGFVRETALSGEPSAVVKRLGDAVRAGTWSEDGVFTVKVTAVLGQRELDLILETVDQASMKPSELQNEANRMVRFFLPIVVFVSIVAAVYWFLAGDWFDAVFNSMAVLLVACPCALGLASPVAVWQGLFELSRIGLVSRDGRLLDALAQTRRIFFDKTGTLTEGALSVREFYVLPAWSERRSKLLEAIADIEGRIQHPVAQSLSHYAGANNSDLQVSTIEIIAGSGVVAQVDWGEGVQAVSIGEPDLAPKATLDSGVAQLKFPEGKHVYVFVEEVLAAIFVLAETARSEVDVMLKELADVGIDVEVLTGDPDPQIELKSDVSVRAGLSALEKKHFVEKASGAGDRPVFIGDGVNDSPAMAVAAASIAMGSGTALASSAATAVMLNDQLTSLKKSIFIARAVQQRLRRNIQYAFAYNLFGMSLAACGILHPVVAAVIMLVSSFFVVARALRPIGSDNNN